MEQEETCLGDLERAWRAWYAHGRADEHRDIVADLFAKAVIHPQQLLDADIYAGLLTRLALCGLGQALVALDSAARQRPGVAATAMADQQHRAIAHNQRAHADQYRPANTPAAAAQPDRQSIDRAKRGLLDLFDHPHAYIPLAAQESKHPP